MQTLYEIRLRNHDLSGLALSDGERKGQWIR